VFCAPGLEASFPLPVTVPDSVRVAERFDVRPIMTVWKDPTRFYVLVVEKGGARIGLATSRGLALCPLTMPDMGDLRRTLVNIDRRAARMLKPESAPVVIVAAAEAHEHLAQVRRLERVGELPSELTGLPLAELHAHALRVVKDLLRPA